MANRQPCIECRALPPMGARRRCRACYFRHRPIGERIDEARRRLALVPEEFRLSRVPAKHWPDGERWCAGCQSFVPLEDCRGSRCVPCASDASHGAMVEKTYGIDAAEYARLLEVQDGRCAICRNRPGKKRLAVDHDHQTGEVRGLLCGRCNHDLLGAGYDSPLKLLAAYHYLNTPTTSGRWKRPEDGLVAPAEEVAPEVGDVDLDPPERGRKTGKAGDAPSVGASPALGASVLLPDLAGAKRLGTVELGRVLAWLDDQRRNDPAPF